MKKKISIAPTQDLQELLEIKKKNFKATFLPLDFSSLLYCKYFNLDHIDPLNFLNNNVHKKGIINHYKIKSIIEKKFQFNTQKKQFVIFQCYGLNAFYFVSCLLKAIENKYKIEKVYLSGWRRLTSVAEGEHYSLFDIFTSLENYNLFLLNDKENRTEIDTNFYEPSEKLKISGKKIFFTDTGYNFRNIILKYAQSGYQCVVLGRKKINIFKKLFFRLIKIRFIYLKENKLKKKSIKKIKIRLNKNLKKLQKYLEIRGNIYLRNIINLEEKCKAIKNILENVKPIKIILNHSVSYNTFILNFCKQKKIPLTLIGHGTLSKGKNKYEKIYHEIIANAVYSSDASSYPVQSKIIDGYLTSKKIFNNPKGNIVFSQVERKKSKYILYAVTLKNFSNMIFYGQELFYEYFENLNFLDKFAKKNKLNICVKHHPNYLHTNKISSKFFKNLTFLKTPMNKILENTEMLLTFSSSTIEDALSSKIPVILFDPWKRYKHCKAEKDPKKKNKSLYYVNSEQNLKKTINTIRLNKDNNFDEYIYSDKLQENIKRLLEI